MRLLFPKARQSLTQCPEQRVCIESTGNKPNCAKIDIHAIGGAYLIFCERSSSLVVLQKNKDAIGETMKIHDLQISFSNHSWSFVVVVIMHYPKAVVQQQRRITQSVSESPFLLPPLPSIYSSYTMCEPACLLATVSGGTK